ncbi:MULTISPECIES: hypothetical protein [Cupriavidus]
MQTFNLTCTVTVSAHTQIRATSLEEAIAQANRREVVLGGTGSGESADASWLIEEADGTPQHITVQQ